MVTAADLLSFSQHDQKQRKVTCIFPRLTPKSKSKSHSQSKPDSPYCGISIKAEEIQNIRNIRAQILESATDVTDLLKQYARACCCPRWHSNRLDEMILQDLCQLWMVEVEEEKERGRRIATDERSTSDNKDEVTTTVTEIESESKISGDEDNFEYQPYPASTTLIKSPMVHQRITRSQARSAASIIIKVTDIPAQLVDDFSPHAYAAKTTVAQVLTRPLRKRDFRPGSVYMFTREQSEGFVKIGCSKNVDKRMAAIEKRCFYKPKVVDRCTVQYMHRVENLIHHELNQYWRRENKCRGILQGCQVQHQEWFEVKVSIAMEVMKGWVEWMSQANPYDEKGHLNDKWAKILQLLAKDKSVTAQLLLDEMDVMQGIQSSSRMTIGNEKEAAAIENKEESNPAEQNGSRSEKVEDGPAAAGSGEAQSTEEEDFEVEKYDEEEERIIEKMLDSLPAAPTAPPSTTYPAHAQASIGSPPITPQRQTMPPSPPLTNPTAASSSGTVDIDTAMQVLLNLPQTDLDTFLRRLSNMRVAAGLSPPVTPFPTPQSDGSVFGPATTLPGAAKVQPPVGQQTPLLA